MTVGSAPFDGDALSRGVPRYTSYPTAPHFSPEVGAETYGRWLRNLPANAAISLYLHIPFCDQLCWFCACRTQGTTAYYPVSRYLQAIEREIDTVAAHIGGSQRVTQVHWGGGSPTVLAPGDIRRLARHVRARFPGAENSAFAVEIDPRDMTAERLAAFRDTGITRASIGVQDFDEAVQHAIGRVQGRAMTCEVIEGLRDIGVRGINVDLVYGLPRQTEASLAHTLEQVIAPAPDRIALFGYAHVPWMAKRQKMIDEAHLPSSAERQAQAARAARMLVEAGYTPVGIDHFALPGDALARARDQGRLRRNFQGYTVDEADALIGFGASAIGLLPQGYVQNDPITAAYQLRALDRGLATKRGIAFTLDDRVRRDAIGELLCHFRLDIERLEHRYGDFAHPLAETAAALLASAPPGALEPRHGGFTIAQAWRSHTRLIAAEFDAYFRRAPARHSLAV